MYQHIVLLLLQTPGIEQRPNGYIINLAKWRTRNIARNGRTSRKHVIALDTLTAKTFVSSGDVRPVEDAALEMIIRDDTRRTIRSLLILLPDQDRRLILLTVSGVSYEKLPGNLGSRSNISQKKKRIIRQMRSMITGLEI
jgi:hypothetical protein